MIDAAGIFYPDWPGQPDPRFTRQTVPNPWAQLNSWQQPPAPPTPPAASSAPQQAHQAALAAPQTVTKAIIPIGKIEDSNQYHVAPGQTMIFLTTDEQTFVVKEGTSDGTGYTLGIYDRRPPAPPAQPAPVFDPRQYLTRDETIQLVRDTMLSYWPAPAPRVSRIPEPAPAVPAAPPHPITPAPPAQELSPQRHILADNNGEAQG